MNDLLDFVLDRVLFRFWLLLLIHLVGVLHHLVPVLLPHFVAVLALLVEHLLILFLADWDSVLSYVLLVWVVLARHHLLLLKDIRRGLEKGKVILGTYI